MTFYNMVMLLKNLFTELSRFLSFFYSNVSKTIDRIFF